jgi:methionyl-tRNA formyltransferase
MRLILFGHSKWACLTLRALVEAGHEIAGVVTETDAFDEREAEVYRRFARHGAYESLKEAARHAGIRTYQPEDIHEPGFMAGIDALQPQLLVSVSYHAIFKPPWFEKYPDRIINAHLAPLPYYRGRAPINWAIINGETRTALTVHFIDEGVDTGPIIKQEPIPIDENDRAIDVLLRALPRFPELVLASVRLIEEGRITARPQPGGAGTYFPRRTPEDGLVDWQAESTRDIHNKIRALSHPYPGAFSYCGSGKVVFESSKVPGDGCRITPVGGLVVAATPGEGIRVTTADGWLEIGTVRVDDDEVPAARHVKVGSRFLSLPEPIKAGNQAVPFSRLAPQAGRRGEKWIPA